MDKRDEKKKAAKYDPTLTAEEKKDARKLTGKEWLYRIGRADDSMWDQSKKKTTYRWAKRIDGHFDEIGVLLSILSIILTLIGFGVTYVQINQANESYRESARQFQQSAPSFFRFPFHNLLPAAFLRQIHGSADRYRQVRYAFRYRRVRKTCVGIARYRRSMSLWKRSRMCWAVSGWSIRSLMMGMIVLSSGRYRRRVRQRRRGGS